MKKAHKVLSYELFSCRGRSRTYTRRLAIAQIRLVVNPLRYVCPVIPTLETRGHVCQFHHPTKLEFPDANGLFPALSGLSGMACFQ